MQIDSIRSRWSSVADRNESDASPLNLKELESSLTAGKSANGLLPSRLGLSAFVVEELRNCRRRVTFTRPKGLLQHPVFRDAALCISFANASFFRVWEETLDSQSVETLALSRVPTAVDYYAAISAVLLVAALLFGGLQLCRKYVEPRRFRLVRFASFALLALPLNGIRVALSAFSKYLKSPMLELLGPRILLLLVLPSVAAAIWSLWKWQREISKGLTKVFLATLPLCALTFGQSAWRAVTYRSDLLADRPNAAPFVPAKKSPRVVWAIFDEWDYRLTFVDRPAGLSLPAVDRLRSESIFASDAHSPTMDTATSLPSLITGRVLRLAVGPGGVPIFSEGAKSPRSFTLDRIPSIFSATRESGYNDALIGWYLPYCRMLNRFVTSCAWWPIPLQFNSSGDTYLRKVAGETVSLFETDSLSPFGRSSAVRHKARMYREYMARASTAVADSDTGFVFLHVPVPHAPHAYDRKTGLFDKKNAPLSGYVDSLSLMDRTLAELRQDMEAHGLWENTTLIISADHPYREARGIDGKFDYRVPFLVKLAGQETAGVLKDRLNTIVTAQFVLGILDRTITEPSDALRWLQEHGKNTTAAVSQ